VGVTDADEYADRAGSLTGHTASYIGIADGVGSWHEFGVDPRFYSTRLMEAAAEHVWRCAANGTAPPSPQDVLAAAWDTVTAERVVGSATASVLTLNSLQSTHCSWHCRDGLSKGWFCIAWLCSCAVGTHCCFFACLLLL
jgi:hypothetical protein